MNTTEYLDDADAKISARSANSDTPSPDDARKLAVTAAGLSAVGGALAASVVVDAARDEYDSETSDVAVVDDSIEVIGEPEPPSIDSFDELFVYDAPGSVPEPTDDIDVRDIETPRIVSTDFGPVNPNEIECGMNVEGLFADDSIPFETDCDTPIV